MATTSEQAAMEPETFDSDDADSALGDMSNASSTTSLRSSIMRFREENGRTYHAYKEGAYFMPNDEIEKDRLDLQNHMFLMTFDSRLTLAPIPDKINRALDIGTGTGIWAIDFADDHPEAEIIGIDLSPIQPMFVPPNLKFEIDDAEADWTFTQKFDFIHSRLMVACFADYQRFFQQAYDNLEPGGYLEMVDAAFPLRSDDDTIPEDSDLRRWSTLMLEGSRILGRPIDIVPQYKDMMLSAGFTNVVEQQYKWPINTWPREKRYKDLGMWCFENFSTSLEGVSYAIFTRALGWEKMEVDVFLAGVRKDIRNRKIHSYYGIYVVYGQKPFDTHSQSNGS